MKIRIRIHLPALIAPNTPNEILLMTKQNKLEGIVDQLYDQLGVPIGKYDNDSKEIVNIFTGRVLLKNGKVVGRFSKEGYIPQDLGEQTIGPRDEIDILFLLAGG